MVQAPLIDVTVLVADDHLGAIDDVAAALREAGLRLDLALPATGVITGSVEDEAALAGGRRGRGRRRPSSRRSSSSSRRPTSPCSSAECERLSRPTG